MNKALIGTKIPEFSLPNQEGDIINISDYFGKPLVIYFYPKDDTPGCTAEACGFRDQYENFVSAGATVFGISNDSVDSHQRFKNRYNLPFDLLADVDNKVARVFGVPTGLFGFIGNRITYIANLDGIIVHAFDSQLNFRKHVSEALNAISAINAGESSSV